MTLNSFAKLNLYLAVINKRKDSFHNIETLFERISLSDKIILNARRDKKINVVCNSCGLPKDPSRNLVYRSAKLLQDTFKIGNGIDIRLIKRIPIGAGLGGGSSNAAATLIGLNKIWKLNLKAQKLAALAEKIGSDVPFFIYDTPFACASGRGERVYPLKMPATLKFWHVLVVPKIKVATPLIYNEWDRLNKGAKMPKRRALTRPSCNVRMLIQALRKHAFSLITKNLLNSLEEATINLYPEVARIKKRLSKLGLDGILMSGSGPAVFAVVSSRKEAVSVSKQLRRESGLWRVFTVKTR